jgi:hypothetical protein
MGSSLQISLRDVVLLAQRLKEGVCPDLKANYFYVGCRGCLQSRNSVDHDGGLFIRGRAVVKIPADHWPMCRLLRFSHMRIWVLFPQSRVVRESRADSPMDRATYSCLESVP